MTFSICHTLSPRVLTRNLFELVSIAAMAVGANAQNTPASYATFGAGCAGSNGVPTTSSPNLPVFGSRFAIHLDQARPNATAGLFLGSAQQQAPLDALGAIGCTLLTAPFATIPVATDNQGHAEWNLRVPNDPGLMGFQLVHQWAVVDPANPLSIVVSNGGVATFGVGPQVVVTGVVGPITGPVGTRLTIVGQNLGDDPRGFCFRGTDANGRAVLFLGRSIRHLAGGVDELEIELVAAPEVPLPTVIHMLRGRDREVPPTSSAGVGVAAEEWAFDGIVFPEHMATAFTFTPTAPLPFLGTVGSYSFSQGPTTNTIEVSFPALDPWTSEPRWRKGTRLTANFDWQMTCTPNFFQYDGWFRGKTITGSLLGFEIGEALAAQLATAFNAKYPADADITTSVTQRGADIVVTVVAPSNCTIRVAAGYGTLTISPPLPEATQIVGLSTAFLSGSTIEAVDTSLGVSAFSSVSATGVTASDDGSRVGIVRTGSSSVVESWEWGATPISRGTVPMPNGFVAADLEMIATTPGSNERFAVAVSGNGDPRVVSIDMATSPPRIVDTLTLPESVDRIAVSPNGQFLVASRIAVPSSNPVLYKIVFGVDPLQPGRFAVAAPIAEEVIGAPGATYADALEFNPTGQQLLCGFDNGRVLSFNIDPLPASGSFDMFVRSSITPPALPGVMANQFAFRRDCTKAYVLYKDLVGLNRLIVELNINPTSSFSTTSSGRTLAITGPLFQRNTPMAAIDGGDTLMLALGSVYQRVATDGPSLMLTNAISSGSVGGTILAIDVLGR